MSMKKAVIENNKVVNIIECSDEGLKGLQFPIGQLVWDCGQYAVAIGDDFEDGVFSRGNENISPILTVQDQINELQGIIDIMLGTGVKGENRFELASQFGEELSRR